MGDGAWLYHKNAAGEAINGALRRNPAVKAYLRALPYREIPEAIRIVEGSGAGQVSKLAIQFVILTAARSGEARSARWSEIDLEARTWTMPGDRTKSGKEHRVPLSETALALLGRARRINDRSGLIFPSPRKGKGELGNIPLTKLLRDNGLAELTTVHGLRSTFRDWCAETGRPHEIAEAALAHVVGSARALTSQRSIPAPLPGGSIGGLRDRRNRNRCGIESCVAHRLIRSS